MKFIAVLTISWMICGTAMAANIKICGKVNVSYTDNDEYAPLTNGTGVDYLDDYAATARGSLIQVSRTSTGTSLFSNYALDGLNGSSGCTALFNVGTLPQTIDIRIWTQGNINGHGLDVENSASGNLQSIISTRTISTQPANDTVEVTISPSGVTGRAFDAYIAGALALYRHNMGATGGLFLMSVDDAGGNETSGPGGGYDATILLTSTGARRKFTVAHELGHAVLSYRIGTGKAFGDCSISDTQCPASSGIHSMCSKEYQSCAFAEAFAHFYATDAFNDHASELAAYNYYKDEFGLGLPTVDVEGHTSDTSVNGIFPNAYIDLNCTATSDSGRGGEIDWLRQLWDMHTEASSCNALSFNTITSFIDTSDSWWAWTTYAELDDRANVIGGDTNNCWDDFKAVNGINL